MIKDIIKYGEAEVTYKNKEALSKKPILYNLFWETTLRCNAKCKHCGSRAGEDCNFKDELTTEEIDNVNLYFVDDLKKIQGILTFAIEDDSGKFRNHGEAVYDGDVQIFMAPPHRMVPELMDNLFNWMNEVKEKVNPLILSSIFHYEFVFIHPFSDGNGRTARLWQTAILAHWKDLFKYIPIESIIRKHQEEYYTAIQNCNNAGNSNEFIEFMLKVINEAVDGMIVTSNQETTQETTQKTTQEKIINLIKKNPAITQVEMAKILDLTRDGISYNIKILKEKGIIERVGSTKNGIWKINIVG